MSSIHLNLVTSGGFGSLVCSKSLPLTLMRISAGFCPVCHVGLVDWCR